MYDIIYAINKCLKSNYAEHKALLLLSAVALISIVSAGGCGSGSNGGNSEYNTCYLESSPNPCFDPNAEGSTTIVTDQTVEEVIEEQEEMLSFEEELSIVNIFNAYKIAQFAPFCPFEQSELVIKTNRDWHRFRNSCFFSTHDLPPVDFSTGMVLVSIHEFGQLDTTIVSVLEFVDHLTAVIQDDNLTPPTPGYAIDIVSVTRSDLPVDFIRGQIDALPF